MAERDAKVRLELAAAGFLSMMRELQKQSKELGDHIEDIGEAGRKADSKLSPALTSIKKGLGAAKDSLAELGRSLKSTLSQAATLGGALGVGAAIKSATDLQSRYRDIAFAVELATGKAVDLREVQQSVEQAAAKTNQRLEPMAEAFKALAQQGGLQFAKDEIGLMGEVATATGDDVKALGGVGAALVEKFKLVGPEFRHAFGAAIKSAKEAGISTEELSSRIDALAAVGSAAGFKGGEGFAKLSAILAKTNEQTKSVGASTAGLEQIFEQLAAHKLTKGVEGDATEKLRKLFTAGPKATLEFESKLLDKNQKAAFGALAQPFKDAFETARAGGESVKEATKKGLDAYDAALEAAGKSTLDFDRVQKEAAARAQEPKRQLDAAINTFTKAFEKPEAIAAINKLAKAMPKLADMLASLVEFGANHPVLAGVGFVGAKAGGAALGSMGGDLSDALLKRLGGAGKNIGDSIGKAAAAHPGWAKAGAAVGVAAAALIAYEIGKQAIDEHFQQKGKDQSDLAALGANAAAAAGSGDMERMKAQAQTLRQRITKAKENQGGVGGFLDKMAGGVAEIVTGGEVKHDVQANVIAKAEAELRNLEKAMAKGGSAGDKAGSALERTAAAAERAASALSRITPPGAGGGGDGTNGLPGAPGNQPGSAPR